MEPRWKFDIAETYNYCQVWFRVSAGVWESCMCVKKVSVVAEYGAMSNAYFEVFIHPELDPECSLDRWRIGDQEIGGFRRMEFRLSNGSWETLDARYIGPADQPHYYVFATELDDVEFQKVGPTYYGYGEPQV